MEIVAIVVLVEIVETTVNSFERKGAGVRSGSGSERHKGIRLRELDGCDHTSRVAFLFIYFLRLVAWECARLSSEF